VSITSFFQVLPSIILLYIIPFSVNTLGDNVVIGFGFFLAVVPAPNPVVIKPRPSPNTKTTPSPGTVWLVTSPIHLHTVCWDQHLTGISFSASWSGPISIEQKMTTSWVANGKTYYRYSTVVTNKSNKSLNSLNLSISKLYGPIWGLTKSGDSYTFPSWLSSLAAGKSLEFVYIHSTSPADVSVANYVLA